MKLRDITTIHSGYTFRSSLQDLPVGDTAVIQAQDLDNDFGFRELRRIDFPGNKDSYLREGDVLVSARGWPKAAVYHTPASQSMSVAASSVFILRPKNGYESHGDYLAYYLSTSDGIREYKKRSYGASVQAIAKSDLGDIRIPDLTTEQIAHLSDFIRAKKQYQWKRFLYERYLGELETAVTNRLFKEYVK